MSSDSEDCATFVRVSSAKSLREEQSRFPLCYTRNFEVTSSFWKNVTENELLKEKEK